MTTNCDSREPLIWARPSTMFVSVLDGSDEPVEGEERLELGKDGRWVYAIPDGYTIWGNLLCVPYEHEDRVFTAIRSSGAQVFGDDHPGLPLHKVRRYLRTFGKIIDRQYLFKIGVRVNDDDIGCPEIRKAVQNFRTVENVWLDAPSDLFKTDKAAWSKGLEDYRKAGNRLSNIIRGYCLGN